MASQRSLNGNYKMQRSLNGDGIMSSVLFAANNLSDVKNASLARQNLGLIGNVQVGNYLTITNPYDGTSNQTINANGSTNSTPNTLVAYDSSGVLNGIVIKASSSISTTTITSTTPSILFSNKFLANINYVSCNKYVDYNNHTIIQSDGNGNNTLYSTSITSPTTTINFNNKTLTNAGSLTCGSYISSNTMYCSYIDNPINNSGTSTGATQTIDFRQNNVNNINILNCQSIKTNLITDSSGNNFYNSDGNGNFTIGTGANYITINAILSCNNNDIVNVGNMNYQSLNGYYITTSSCISNTFQTTNGNLRITSNGNLSCGDITCANVSTGHVINLSGGSFWSAYGTATSTPTYTGIATSINLGYSTSLTLTNVSRASGTYGIRGFVNGYYNISTTFNYSVVSQSIWGIGMQLRATNAGTTRVLVEYTDGYNTSATPMSCGKTGSLNVICALTTNDVITIAISSYTNLTNINLGPNCIFSGVLITQTS